MNSLIICEGRTDLTLIQYFMSVTNGWEYSNSNEKLMKFKFMRTFHKNSHTLRIGEVCGCAIEIPIKY